ncbi:methionyl-tRNA formyltransferase [Patescibacteria group bacterium]|nr:methionyl-tRNA formyltransferase [Patescibacteria group bacterium]
MSKNKLVFLSSDSIAIPCLNSLRSGYDILVVTKSDKSQKRSNKKQANEFAIYCEDNNIPVIKIDKFTEDILSKLKNHSAEYAVCFSFGLIIPNSVLNLYPNKLLNVHPSKLPQYRGPSPIQEALLNGDTTTAISYMIMDSKMDEGDILKQITIDIKDTDTYTSLAQNIANISGENIANVLKNYMDGSIKAIPQKDNATYCKMIDKKNGEIDYNNTAKEIYNRYRAYYEWPKIYTYWNDKKLILTNIEYSDISNKELGEVFEIDKEIFIQLKEGSIKLNELQLEGKKNMPIKAFINGHKEFIGSNLISSQ